MGYCSIDDKGLIKCETREAEMRDRQSRVFKTHKAKTWSGVHVPLVTYKCIVYRSTKKVRDLDCMAKDGKIINLSLFTYNNLGNLISSIQDDDFQFE